MHERTRKRAYSIVRKGVKAVVRGAGKAVRQRQKGGRYIEEVARVGEGRKDGTSHARARRGERGQWESGETVRREWRGQGGPCLVRDGKEMGRIMRASMAAPCKQEWGGGATGRGLQLGGGCDESHAVSRRGEGNQGDDESGVEARKGGRGKEEGGGARGACKGLRGQRLTHKGRRRWDRRWRGDGGDGDEEESSAVRDRGRERVGEEGSV